MSIVEKETAPPAPATWDARAEYLDLLKRCLSGYLYPETFEFLPPSKLPGPVGDRDRRLFNELQSRGLRLVRPVVADDQKRQAGRDWPAIAYTMIGLKRLSNVQACAETVLREDVPGDFCETGVWRGGTTIFMRAILKAYGDVDRGVWVADSFEGMPKPNVAAYPQDEKHDISHVDQLAVSLEAVQRNFQRFGMLDERVRFLKGWFRDTLPRAPIETLSLLRLDGDLYESTMDALTALYDRVSPGGFVIVDDYLSWEPCRAATDDFRRQRAVTDEIIPVDWTGVYWRKSR